MSIYKRYSTTLRSLIVLLIVALLLILQGNGQGVNARNTPNPLDAIFERANSAMSHTYSAELEQYLVPMATTDMVGAGSQKISMMLNGSVAPEQTEVVVSTDIPTHGTNTLRVVQKEDGTFYEQDGQLEAVTNPFATFNPTGDFVSYLAVADNVTLVSSEDGVERYHFEIDGEKLSEYIATELRPTIHTENSTFAMSPSPLIARLSGSGDHDR